MKKKVSRRNFLKQIAFASASVSVLGMQSFASKPHSSRRKMIIDSDTGTGIDDFFALVRALQQPDWQVLGIASAQSRSRGKPAPNRLAQTNAFHKEIKQLFPESGFRPLQGKNLQKPDWENPKSYDSEAARFIIQQAKALPQGEKLEVLCFTPHTNLSAALKIAPEIAPNVVCRMLGLNFFDQQSFLQRKTNPSDTPDCIDVLLENATEVFFMFSEPLIDFQMSLSESLSKGSSDTAAYLAACWRRRFVSFSEWNMWYLGLVQAAARPDLAQVQAQTIEIDGRKKQINFYTRTDNQAFARDFWQVIR